MHKFILAALSFVLALAAAANEPVRSVRLWENGPAFADRNIGAEQPWGSGSYFWWGDARGYRMSNGVWMASDGSTSGFSFKEGTCPSRGKYRQVLQQEGWITADGLSPKCDAASVLWGTEWRIPTVSELSDLVAKCDWRWESTNGVFGCRVSGRGKYAAASIFLPAAGDACSERLDDSGSLGFYWSSEPYPGSMNYAWHLLFSNGGQYMSNGNRDDGYSIRPVRD